MNSTAEEKIVIVDEHNNETGSATRREMRTKNLPHRATFIMVFNSSGQIFVQQRTETKDIYPGCYDAVAGGIVLEGETYETAAARELAEELGIRDTGLTALFDFCHKDENNFVWGRAYSCTYDGPIILQEEEVAWGAFFSLDEVHQFTASKPFTPDGLYVLKRYLEDQ